MDNFFRYFIVVLVTLILSFIAEKVFSKPAQEIEGVVELKLPRFYLVVGLVGMISLLTVAIGSLITEEVNTDTLVLSSFLFFLGIGFGIVVLGYRRHQGFYNREEITTTDLYGKTVSLKWHEISLISFNSLTSNILLHSKDGQKLKVHMHLKGAKNIVQRLKNMDVSAKNQAVPYYKA